MLSSYPIFTKVSAFQEIYLPQFFTRVMQWFLFNGEPTPVTCFCTKSFHTIRSKNSPDMRKKPGIDEARFLQTLLFSFTFYVVKYVRFASDEVRPYLLQYSLEIASVLNRKVLILLEL
jgi:hypothetical protein